MKTPHMPLVLCALLTLFLMFASLNKAQATSLGCCSCEETVDRKSNDEWFNGDDATVPRINRHVESEFTAHRQWFVAIFWEDNVLPAMMLMAEQLSAVAMQQTQIIGSFFDAKQQLETQQLLREINTQAHKDYHPSIGMCEFGTATKSLASSERKGELATYTMSQRMQDRALGQSNTSAATGPGGNQKNMLEQFKTTFCDPSDNNNGLKLLCRHDNGIGASNPERMNKDIDYARTFEWPWTLKVDFSDTSRTDHEEEIMALGANLYGHEVFFRPPHRSLATVPGEDITFMQQAYQDTRAILAKRAVAENSFNAITAMKAEGTEGSREYLIEVLKELGLETDDAQDLLVGPDGDQTDPSYYAQMEILTKKVYQNPDFYTHLYDKPANVRRKNVAMQAIGLMQKFDLFKSYLRNEAAMSVLLELAVMDLQDEVEDAIGETTPQGTK